MKLIYSTSLVFLGSLCFAIKNGDAAEIGKTNTGVLDINLSSEQRAALDQFKNEVADKVPHDYMKEEFYLLRFLEETDFNRTEATSLLKTVLMWRKDNRIDHLVSEEFPDLDVDYSLYLEGCDRKGRPIVSVPFGEWDLKQALLDGKEKKLMRYIEKIFEDADQFLRDIRAVGSTKLRKVVVIVDLDGFHMLTHACPKCVKLYLYFFTVATTHYPGLLDHLYLVHTPQIANYMFDLYPDILTPRLKAKTTIYFRTNNDWIKQLHQQIDPSQLSKRFGGSKIDPLEATDYIINARNIDWNNSTVTEAISNLVVNQCDHDLATFEKLARDLLSKNPRKGRKTCK